MLGYVSFIKESQVRKENCRVSMTIFSFKYRNVILGVTATAVGYYAVLMPHTVFLKKYRYIVGLHQSYEEIPLGSKVQRIIQKVMDDLKLSNDARDAIKPFSIIGLDLFHAGTLNAKYGAILGIPVNFTNTMEELRENLEVREEPIDWTRHDAKSLLTSLTLSENAQKFAIAREILRVQAEEPYFNSLVLALTVATLWILYSVVAYKFRLREGIAIARRMFYAVLTLFGAIFWFGVKDYRSYQLDMENDEALCRLGTEYIEGGQEFYGKTLVRNKALRSLLGAEGKSKYTAGGNEESFLRRKHVLISHRKDFFDLYLQNLKGTK